jgi:predicted ATPase with chaperone activity
MIELNVTAAVRILNISHTIADFAQSDSITISQRALESD